MKQVYIFIITIFCCVSVTINAQQPFRYDTIRAGTGRVPMSERSAFRYDTIRSTKSNAKTNVRKPVANAPTKTKSSFDKKKLFFGGNFGLQFGNYTLVDISPQIGYAFSRYASAGLGISYTHINTSFISYYDYKDTRNYAGFNFFGRFYPIPNIVLSVQPEINYFWGSYNNVNVNYYSGYYGGNNNGNYYEQKKYISSIIPAFLVGGGLRIPAGTAGSVLMMVQYDLIQDRYLPYGTSFFYSVGYTFGF